MSEGHHQEANGDGNIQAGRDVIVKIFKLSRASRAEAIRAIDGYLVLFYLILIVALFGTTLPHPTLNIITSIATVSALVPIALLHWERTRLTRFLSRPVGHLRTAAIALVALSLFSGCSSSLFRGKSHLAQVCNDTSGGPCVSAEIAGVGILGFGLEDITVATAVKKGQLNKVVTSSEVRSYGLISMARVTVYGE